MEEGRHFGECLCREQREGSQYQHMSRQYIKKFSECARLIAGVGFILCALHLVIGSAVIVEFRYLRSGQIDGHQSSTHLQQQQQQQLLQYEKPSALLTAPESYNLTRTTYLEWESEKGYAHLQGFGYDDGDLVVYTSGSYRIYLQITYHCSSENALVFLSQEVVLYANNYKKNKILIQSVDYVECKVRARKSISTTAVFSLSAQDRLRVSALKHELIVLNEKQVYFGVDLG